MKGAMGHKFSKNLKAGDGSKSRIRQWHHKSAVVLELVTREHKEIIHKLVRNIDLGKKLDKILTALRGECGGVSTEASGDIWNVLGDKRKVEAHDMIKMNTEAEGVVAHRVMHRWFTNVSGLGLAEQARY